MTREAGGKSSKLFLETPFHLVVGVVGVTAILTVLGCSKPPPPPPPAPVKGRVFFGSKSVPYARIDFYLDREDGAMAQPFTAFTDNDGFLDLTLAPANYKVTVRWATEAAPLDLPVDPSAAPRIPDKFKGEPTEVKKEVPKPKSRKPPFAIPYNYTRLDRTPLRLEVPEAGLPDLELSIERDK